MCFEKCDLSPLCVFEICDFSPLCVFEIYAQIACRDGKGGKPSGGGARGVRGGGRWRVQAVSSQEMYHWMCSDIQVWHCHDGADDDQITVKIREEITK